LWTLPSSSSDTQFLQTGANDLNNQSSATVRNSDVVDADEPQARTGIPASWWMAQARERRVPFRKLGRYVRFDVAEIMSCDAYKRRVVGNGESRSIRRVRMAVVRRNRGRYVADFRDQNRRRHIETPKGVFETAAHER
jgi:hypothetical protein